MKEAVQRVQNRLDRLREKFGRPGREALTVDGELRPVQDEFGRELLDSTPMAPPVGHKKQPSMVELVREMVKSEHLRRAALESGHETFEEADDFDVGDEDDMPSSPHENEFDPPVSELLREGEKAKRDREEGEFCGISS